LGNRSFFTLRQSHGSFKNSPARTRDNKQRSLQAFLWNKSFVHSTFNGHSPRSPITDHQSPITDHQSPITDHRSPITDHRSPIADHRTHRHGIRDLGIKRSSIRDKPIPVVRVASCKSQKFDRSQSCNISSNLLTFLSLRWLSGEQLLSTPLLKKAGS